MSDIEQLLANTITAPAAESILASEAWIDGHRGKKRDREEDFAAIAVAKRGHATAAVLDAAAAELASLAAADENHAVETSASPDSKVAVERSRVRTAVAQTSLVLQYVDRLAKGRPTSPPRPARNTATRVIYTVDGAGAVRVETVSAAGRIRAGEAAQTWVADVRVDLGRVRIDELCRLTAPATAPVSGSSPSAGGGGDQHNVVQADAQRALAELTGGGASSAVARSILDDSDED